MSLMTEGFYSSDAPTREMQYFNDFHNAITLEMTFTHRSYLRRVYSTLDLLADVGGLYAAVRAPSAVIIGVLNFYAAY